MSDHIGWIIKLVAVILCVIGIVVSIIGAFTFNLDFGGMISGCCCSVIVSLLVYGFGHLIDETSLNRQINQQILQYLQVKEKEKTPEDAPREVPVAFSSERLAERAQRARKLAANSSIGWTCEKCGSRNGNNDISCKDCGTYK